MLKKVITTVLTIVMVAGSIVVVSAIEPTIVQINADNFKDFVVDCVFLEKDIFVMEAHEDVIWARHRGTELLKSTDQGLSWTLVHKFEKPINAIYCDDCGNVFVALTLDRWAADGTGQLYRSADDGENFCMVLDLEAGVSTNWNITSSSDVMLVSEYGYKGNNSNNARKIYRSLDFGQTWEIVFNPTPQEEWHNHKILITHDGTIYQSIGDGANARIIKSIDNGNTWATVIYRFHPTSAVDFDTHILWGLDTGPWAGVARYDKQTGQMSRSLVLPQPFNGAAYDMAVANGIVYAMFMSYEGHSHPASIFYSEDEGLTWNLLGYIEKEPHHGVGLTGLTVYEEFGYISIQTPIYNDDEVEIYFGTLRFELMDS